MKAASKLRCLSYFNTKTFYMRKPLFFLYCAIVSLNIIFLTVSRQSDLEDPRGNNPVTPGPNDTEMVTGGVSGIVVDENNQPVMRRIPFSPVLFVSSPKATGNYKTLYGERVEPIEFESMSEASAFQKQYENVQNFKVYGQTNYVTQFTLLTRPHFAFTIPLC